MHEPLKKLHNLPEFENQLPRLVQLVPQPNLLAGYRLAVLNVPIKKSQGFKSRVLGSRTASSVNKIMVTGLVLFVRGKDEDLVLVKYEVFTFPIVKQ
jgi:hypothetical protein